METISILFIEACMKVHKVDQKGGDKYKVILKTTTQESEEGYKAKWSRLDHGRG